MAAAVAFTVKFGKENIPIELPCDATVQELKEQLKTHTLIEPGMQKVMFKGQLKDDGATLSSVGLKSGSKVMLVGSTLAQVINANVAPPPPEKTEEATAKPEPLPAEQRQHERISKLGPPADATPADTTRQTPITPGVSLSGMYNAKGDRVRVTVKADIAELWVATNTGQQKIPFNSISDIEFVPIAEHEGYVVAVVKVGANHKLYLYYLPVQFTKSFKGYILGWDFG